tara:strand:+ start:202 stop:471 length:270 start_codon:yes stop_codon:yes gene_type:complete
MEKPNRPEKKISAGAIHVTIWNNEFEKNGQISEFKTISFDRNYKDKDGAWKSTNQLRVNDIPKAVAALNKAYETLILKDNSYVKEEIIV